MTLLERGPNEWFCGWRVGPGRFFWFRFLGRDSLTTSLPHGWALAALGDLGIWRGGGTPSKSSENLWRNGILPWISPKDMKRRVIEDAVDKLSDAALTHPSTKLVPAGSVLIVVRSGILRHSLPVAVTARQVAINQDIKALIPREGVSATYVAAQVRAESQNILEATVKSGTTVESIDFARLSKFQIRIAPTREQGRIVAKLEPVLARCASARAELARVAKLTARLRRATFSAGFRGTLYSIPRDPNGDPLGWTTVPLGSLLSERPSNGLSPPRSENAKGVLSLRLTATTSGVLRLDPNAVKRVRATLPADSKYWLRRGDLLVQRANALEHVGAAAIFDGEEHKYIYPDLMIRVRIEDELTRRYVWRYLNSPDARRYFQMNATGTAGNMPKITGAVLLGLPVPLSPRDQMGTILSQIETIFTRLDAIERESRQCSRLLDKLEQAFLTKVFSGELVKQDQSEEPATIMLERSRVNESIGSAEERMSAGKPSERSLESARTYVEQRLKVWPADGFTFDELRNDAPGTYEELKDVVFELIESRRLAQRYDYRERKMKLLRST